MSELYLRLDPLNFSEEIEYRIFNKQLTISDLVDLFKDDYIDLETFINGVQYAEYLNDTGLKISSKEIIMETINDNCWNRAFAEKYNKQIQDILTGKKRIE